jgi:pyruvate/2-oxoglutarate dehydrogenase complex dihydrolipoamide acyltransferase (E2) component
MMRIHLLAAAVILIAGCASQPQTAATSAAPAPAPAADAPAAAPATSAVAKAEPKTVQEAQKAGYKIVTEKGKTVYCREQPKTGTRVRTETICLTAEEIEAAREASRRNLDQMQRAIPPPQGT